MGAVVRPGPTQERVMHAVWRRSMAFLIVAVLLVPLLVAAPVGAQDAPAETPVT